MGAGGEGKRERRGEEEEKEEIAQMNSDCKEKIKSKLKKGKIKTAWVTANS